MQRSVEARVLGGGSFVVEVVAGLVSRESFGLPSDWSAPDARLRLQAGRDAEFFQGDLSSVSLCSSC
jgi:hypothetical protein